MGSSLTSFLLCPFLFLCLSCTFANRVLLNSMDGKQVPNVDTVSGPIIGSGQEAMGGAIKTGMGNGHGIGSGVDPNVNGFGVGVGVGVGYGRGFGSGYWPGPGISGPELNNECMMGYVCPTNNRRGRCNNPYGDCQNYAFYPVGTMDVHEVEIKWAKSKPDKKTAQPSQTPPIIDIDDGITKPQHVVPISSRATPTIIPTPPTIVVDDHVTKPQHVVSEPYQSRSPPIIIVDDQATKLHHVVPELIQAPPIET